MLTEREIALGAIDTLEKYGWCQGKLYDEEGRACLIGAVRASAWEFKRIASVGPHGLFYERQWISVEYSDATSKRIENVLTAVRNRANSPASEFNDEPSTSQEDVVLILKKVADEDFGHQA